MAFTAGCLSFVVMVLLVVSPVLGLNNGLAITPPMGWSSWNHYHRNYNETVFYGNAKAMASNGMKVRHYTDSGTHFCNKDGPASYGYEEQDAKLFVSFGSDMVKIDACSSPANEHEQIMAKWSRLLNATGRPVLISNCHNSCQTSNWAEWCPTSANMWRSSGDIGDAWGRIMSNLHTLVGRGSYGGPGRWNDPDFLEVGNSGINDDEAESHFSLWCVTSSPLIAGNDLTTMPESILKMLTNKVAISVNQRYLHSAGDQVMVNGTMEVWAKPLPDNEFGVVLLNKDDHDSQSIIFPLSKLGVAQSATCHLHDIWRGTNSTATGTINLGLQGIHSVRFLLVSNCM